MSNIVSGTQVLSQTTSVIVPTENKTSVSLTQIMQEALDRFQFDNVILRCDHLPEVFVNKEAATTLCTTLLQTIFNGNNGKLFLYIKCEDANDIIDLTPVKNYTISFHTNRQCSEQWQKENQEQLQQCKTIVQSYGGVFSCSNGNSGCLFLVTLPGKPS